MSELAEQSREDARARWARRRKWGIIFGVVACMIALRPIFAFSLTLLKASMAMAARGKNRHYKWSENQP